MTSLDGPDELDSSGPRGPQSPRGVVGTWLNRVMVILVVLVVGYLAWRLAAAYFPRRWAQHVGDTAQGSMLAGSLWGLFYGFVFSFIPVLVLVQLRRPRFAWPAKLVIVALAVVLAIPNLLTASIVFGSSSAAHAGERILDVEGPGFRAGTLVGVFAGVGLAVFLVIVFANRRRMKARLARAEEELHRSRRDGDEKDVGGRD